MKASHIDHPSLHSPSAKSSKESTRRTFLKQSSAAGLALAFPFVSHRNVLGANNRLNIAGIGIGGLGNSAVRVGHGIDWDPAHLKVSTCEEGNKLVSKKYREGWSY
jgi:hypothetical protein